mmetsp:Transcript_10058/g.22355  ORF Transcript_10058/g.22355 Transcript_10058/m.22355 type:complete len:363 (-) Transcript_10058:220-1308(-)
MSMMNEAAPKAQDDFILLKGKGCRDQIFRVVRNQIPAELASLLTKPFTEEQRQQIFRQVGLHTAKRVQVPHRPKALLIFGPPAVGKSTISLEVAKSIFDNAGNVVIVDGNDVRDAHEGFSQVAQHGLTHNLLHTDAWDILKGTKHVENLKKEIMNLAVQNRQDVIIPECALNPERVHQMLRQMENADYEMHAICLWAPLDSVQQRGSQRSLKAGKAYAPKFHTPSCAGSLEFGRHFDLKIREGCRHYCSLICYDNTVKPSHPVHLVEFEHLIKMGPEETKEHIRNCMLARAAYMIEHGGSRASSDTASTPLLVPSNTSDRLPLSGCLRSMLEKAAVRRGRRQGLLCGLFLALVFFSPLLYWI